MVAEACTLCKRLTAQGRLHQTLMKTCILLPCVWPHQSQAAKLMTLRHAQEPIVYMAAIIAILQAASVAKRIFCCSLQPQVCINSHLPRAGHNSLHRVRHCLQSYHIRKAGVYRVVSPALHSGSSGGQCILSTKGLASRQHGASRFKAQKTLQAEECVSLSTEGVCLHMKAERAGARWRFESHARDQPLLQSSPSGACFHGDPSLDKLATHAGAALCKAPAALIAHLLAEAAQLLLLAQLLERRLSVGRPHCWVALRHLHGRHVL